MFFPALIFGITLKELKSNLKIGIRKEIKGCTKFVNDEDWVYAHIIARVEGRSQPIVDTYHTGKPMHFYANESTYIEGFTRGIRGACEGEIRRITIPPELAYKGESVDGLFGPHSTWIVDAEILEIVKTIMK